MSSYNPRSCHSMIILVNTCKVSMFTYIFVIMKVITLFEYNCSQKPFANFIYSNNFIYLLFFLFVNLVFKVVLHRKHVHSIIRSFFMLKIWWLHILHPRELHVAQRLKRQGAHLVKTFFSIFSNILGP